MVVVYINFFLIAPVWEHCFTTSYEIALYDLCIMFLSMLHKDVQSIFMQKVVTIKKRNIISCHDLHSCITSRRKASILFMHDLDTIVLCGIVITNITTIIRRPIINKNKFPVRVRLAEDTLNTIWQVLFNLIARNYYRY